MNSRLKVGTTKCSPISFVKTKPESCHSGPAFSLCSICCALRRFNNCITHGAGVIRRGLLFFNGAKMYAPFFFFSCCSCLSINTVPLSKLTHSHNSPNISPSRIPVKRATVKKSSYLLPLIACRNAALCTSSSGQISFLIIRGSVQASEGLKRRYPIITACCSALCKTPCTFLMDFADKPGFPFFSFPRSLYKR